MRPSDRTDPDLLDDIRRACSLVSSFMQNVKLPDLAANLEKQSAVAHQLLAIGEAGHRLSPKVKRALPGIRWRDLYRFRNVVAHDYYKIDVLKMWEIVQDDVPKIMEYLA
jgi:uncharacterized protein with HEPN domain